MELQLATRHGGSGYFIDGKLFGFKMPLSSIHRNEWGSTSKALSGSNRSMNTTNTSCSPIQSGLFDSNCAISLNVCNTFRDSLFIMGC